MAYDTHHRYRDSDIETVMSAPPTHATSSSSTAVAASEDEPFDPISLQSQGLNSNLVRGASTRTKNTLPLGDSNRSSYVDDDFNYYSNHPQGENSDSSLVKNAADLGRSDDDKARSKSFQDLEYSDPYNSSRAQVSPERSTAFSKFLGNGKYPIEQRIEDKKRGIGRQKYPFLVWLLTAIMVAVFIYELVSNSQAQGTPVSFHPVVNYMLGPSSSTLINVGARWPPCMKYVEQIPPSFLIGCPNNTANPAPANETCTVAEICGFGGISNDQPNQWFRFITAIFLHAGFVHIILNMIAQLTVTAQIEREMGSGGFFLTYFAAGIFGNVLGGNFALVGIPSVGASGAIFGTVAVTWVDLFAHWRYKYRPVRMLIFMALELVIGVAIGFIPYVDNFAHLGGFLMGLLVGTIFYPVISLTRRHKLIMWGFRITALPFAIVLFVVLIRNFYTSDPYAACSGCRYLSCIPMAANNHCQGVNEFNELDDMGQSVETGRCAW